MNVENTHWLNAAAEKAGYVDSDADELRAEVGRRLRKGALEYGDDAYLTKDLEELIGEAAEEGVDLPSWLLLAVRKLRVDAEGRPERVVEHTERMLVEAAAKALQARHLLQQAQELWGEHAPELVVSGRPYDKYFEP